MFKILDGRKSFYQWDINRKIIINDETIKEVHFCNRQGECSLVVEVNDGVANVPNIMLQTNNCINVYAYDGEATRHSKTFLVKARSKPEDYVYTETEIKNYDTLKKYVDDTIANIEVNGVNITVDDFMSATSENPVQNKIITEHLAGVVQGFTDWSVQVHKELSEEILNTVEDFVANTLPDMFVAKEKDKGLSTNDFTDEYKAKLDALISQLYKEGESNG